MGLDMYLSGRKSDYKFISARYDPSVEIAKVDGFPVSFIELHFGSWRKHSDLHGFIVREFAKGVDECQRIDLDVDALTQTIAAVKEHRLPKTEGFYFGRSARPGGKSKELRQELEEQTKDDLSILEPALEWLKGSTSDDSREVYYQASW